MRSSTSDSQPRPHGDEPPARRGRRGPRAPPPPARPAPPPGGGRAAPAPGAPMVASDHLPERGMDPGAVLLALLGGPNVASRRPGFEQYDSTVQVNTVVGPGHGAAVLRVKGTSKALVAATDGNATVTDLDP